MTNIHTDKLIKFSEKTKKKQALFNYFLQPQDNFLTLKIVFFLILSLIYQTSQIYTYIQKD